MESVLVDQSLLNPRKNAVVKNRSSYGGFKTRSHDMSSSSSVYSSMNQLFLNLNASSGGSTGSCGLFGSRPPPSRHSFLPSFSATPSVFAPPPAFPPPRPVAVHQPPLLPLPFSKSATLPSPSPTKRIPPFAAAVTTARSRDHRNKTKPDGNSRKEARSSGTVSVLSDPPKGESVSVVPQKSARKPATLPAAAEREEKVEEVGEEKEKEKRFATESVYTLSPPPSSLPLPRFFLKRPKAASATAATCVAEAMGCGDAGFGAGGRGGGGRSNTGATDDLRRLLRL